MAQMKIRKKSAALFIFMTFMGTFLYIELSDPQPQGDPNGLSGLEISLRNAHFIREIPEHNNGPNGIRIINKAPEIPLIGNLSGQYVPGIWTHLPHLGMNNKYLQPRLKLSAGRKDVSIVFGIPTIRRPIGIYVVNTVQSMFENMSEDESRDILIVVCITEPWNRTYENELVAMFKSRFPNQLSQGSLEIIAPYAEFYPDLDKLPKTLGDSKDRVKWRSKQNLDYAYLMMYAFIKGSYYIQLEDDLSTTKGFVKTMKTAIMEQQGEWALLSFSHLGFIGRLFKQEDVPKLLEFLLMFYSRKPCDWLLADFLDVYMCAHIPCKKEKNSWIRLIKPTLFQHQGLRSSLGGTINKLKDKYFDHHKTSEGSILINPPVTDIISTLQQYDKYDIKSAYQGKKLFWGKNPTKGDTITFFYDPPITIQRLAFQSGHKKWPKDVITSADVEIMPEKIPAETFPYKKVSHKEKLSEDSLDRPKELMDEGGSSFPFYTVGSFDETGNLDIEIENNTGKIRILRIWFKEDYQHWVILEQIAILLHGR